MSAPSSTAAEQDSFSSSTSASITGSARFHKGSERKVGEAEVEDARRQAELPALAAHVAQAFEREQMRRAPARVRPVRWATSVSVCCGARASKERITARPRAKDWT